MSVMLLKMLCHPPMDPDTKQINPYHRLILATDINFFKSADGLPFVKYVSSGETVTEPVTGICYVTLNGETVSKFMYNESEDQHIHKPGNVKNPSSDELMAKESEPEPLRFFVESTPDIISALNEAGKKLVLVTTTNNVIQVAQQLVGEDNCKLEMANETYILKIDIK